MLALAVRLVIGISSAFFFLFTAPVLIRDDFPESLKIWRDQVNALGGESLQTAIVVLGLLGLFVAFSWSRLLPGPRLVGGNFVEFTRDALGGPGLQVLGVEVYNEREWGGERKTARGVVAELEAFDSRGDCVAVCDANWFPNALGGTPDTVDFRPTREKHPLELAGKFPYSADAWLAGERDPPSLTPGVYKIRATLRGGNLRRPRRLKWFVRNPGPGGKLMASDDKSALPPVPELPESQDAESVPIPLLRTLPAQPLKRRSLRLSPTR